MRIQFLLFVFFLISVPAQACIGTEINAPEALAKRQKADFERHDMNKDGQVTVGEYIQTNSNGNYGGHVDTKPFLKYDKNKSATLTFDEWQNFRHQSYYILDSIMGGPSQDGC